MNRVWLTAAMLLWVGLLLARSLALSPASRLAPLWVLYPTLALLLLQLVVDVRPQLAQRLPVLRRASLLPSAGAEGAPRPSTEPASPEGRRRREMRVTVWIAWLIALMYLVGFVLATTLFLLPYLRMEAGTEWRVSLALTGAAAAVIYLVFGVLARVPFPPGVLF